MKKCECEKVGCENIAQYKFYDYRVCENHYDMLHSQTWAFKIPHEKQAIKELKDYVRILINEK